MRSIKLPSWTERLLGFEPISAPPNVFAIDGHHLRFGRFQRDSSRFAFDSYRILELAENPFSDGPLGGPLRDPAAFQELIDGFVQSLEPAPTEASLLLPDAWLRLTFAELSELPTQYEQREEVLRWTLKRLVPFRIEDLRVSALKAAPLPSQEEPHRLLIGFAIEKLLGQLEEAFAAAGVRLGYITNSTLATLAGLAGAMPSDAVAAVVLVDYDAYTISFARGDEPLLYRYKAIGEVPEHERAVAVQRDLRLTKRFVQEHVGSPVTKLLLTAPMEHESAWLSWLGEAFEIQPETLAFEHFPLSRAQADLSWSETAALLGAAALEVHWS